MKNAMALSERSARARDKVKGLDDLACILANARAEGKRVAHCHGVFDLLHIGHIRHLEQARQFGDLLVVTVTPDRFVNKGPHRPAFPEQLRAEAVAALDCVEYVAVNKWPSASGTIEMLRPDVYVKGAEYRDRDNDPTGGIGLEEAAVRAVGGRLAFTDDITFSSSSLLNRHLPIFPVEVQDYLRGFAARYREGDVLRYLDGARPLKVLVVGEAIIDEYRYCEAIGKSSKEPMLALKHLSTERFAGGILAVGNHVAAFSEDVGLLSFLGAEQSHEQFVREKLDPKIRNLFLYRTGSPTIVKQRIVEEYFFTKLVEVYEINDAALDERDEHELCELLREHVPQYDVVVVVDFGHGMLTPRAIDVLCSKSRFLAVNSQSNAGNLGYHTISRYPRADYVCIAEHELRLDARDRHGDLRAMMLDVAGRLGCPWMAVTRGKHGCVAYSREEGFVEVPAFAGQVVDRMGAGDAFLSVTALCVAQKAPVEVFAFIGNAIGAHAVAAVGHRHSVERTALLKQITSLLK